MKLFLLLHLCASSFITHVTAKDFESVQEIVQEYYECAVLEWDGTFGEQLEVACNSVMDDFNVSTKINYDRMNEVGGFMEGLLMDKLSSVGLHCEYARTKSGKLRRVGYPDLVLTNNSSTMYVEVKAYSPHTLKSSHRSFYLSYSNDPKVTKDAYHVVVAFEVDKENDSHYFVNSYTCIDISNLPLRKKIEHNASNKVLYGREGVYRITSKVNQ